MLKVPGLSVPLMPYTYTPDIEHVREMIAKSHLLAVSTRVGARNTSPGCIETRLQSILISRELYDCIISELCRW